MTKAITLNKEAIKKTIDLLKTAPSRVFNVETFRDHNKYKDRDEYMGCVAYFVVMANEPWLNIAWHEVEKNARRILGLKADQAGALFYPIALTLSFNGPLSSEEITDRILAKHAIATLNHLSKTNKVVWHYPKSLSPIFKGEHFENIKSNYEKDKERRSRLNWKLVE